MIIKKTVLLVEDSDKDAELIMTAMKKAHDIVTLERVRDGAEAVEFLQKIDKHDLTRPLCSWI
jgi:CheY-like chemotaxis protein